MEYLIGALVVAGMAGLVFVVKRRKSKATGGAGSRPTEPNRVDEK